MSNPKLSGAARQLLFQRFGGSFNERESNPIIGAVAAEIVPNHPDRLGLIIVDLGANPVFVGLSFAVTALKGTQLGPQGGAMGVSVDEDFTLVTRQWIGIAPAGNTQLYVLELIREIALPDTGA